MNDITENGKKLPLIDSFYTLQGEGYHTGKAAYFLRIGGCDIGCRWCDSKISWSFDFHKLVEVSEIIEKVKNLPAKAVVVTGGEPLNYNLDFLCQELKLHDIETFIETSGSGEITGNWDWICLSPKRNSPPNPKILNLAHELKIIIFDDDDFEWAIKNSKLVNKDCFLYLQPEWSQHKIMTPKIVEFIKQNPKWKISIQAHKFMKIP